LARVGEEERKRVPRCDLGDQIVVSDMFGNERGRAWIIFAPGSFDQGPVIFVKFPTS